MKEREEKTGKEKVIGFNRVLGTLPRVRTKELSLSVNSLLCS